jgi:hypothetical protein
MAVRRQRCRRAPCPATEHLEQGVDKRRISLFDHVVPEDQHVHTTEADERLVSGVMKGEILHVELKTTISPEPEQLVHFVDIAGAFEGRHAHHLVFALIDLKPRERP